MTDYELYLRSSGIGTSGTTLQQLLENLPPSVHKAVQRHFVNASSDVVQILEHIVTTSRKDLEQSIGLAANEVTILLCEVSKLLYPIRGKSVSEMLQDPFYTNKLSLGCPIIDQLFKGGLPRRGIIEITGEAGSGKSNFCLQACLQTQLKEQNGGWNGGALYISTEGGFPIHRWTQLVHAYLRKYPYLNEYSVNNGLFIEKIDTFDALWGLIKERIRPLLRRHPIKLIVVDSIAALYRYEFTKEQSAERAKVLLAHAHQLNEISEEYKLPILVTNQVTDYFANDTKTSPFEHDDATLSSTLFSSVVKRANSSHVVIPALGLTWANCVTMRILLKKEKRHYTGDDVNLADNTPEMENIGRIEREQEARKELESDEQSQPPSKRRKIYGSDLAIPIRSMAVILSSYLPNKSISFVIDSSGMRGIKNIH